jgi:oxygen-independent coproporphyrinogen III oxidase
MPQDRPIGVRALYVHIPFCHTICPFCAFAVHGNRPDLHAGYLAALLREMDGAPRVEPGAVRSIYLGGGTPSTLSPAELESLLTALRRHFQPSADAELALEVNPDDGTLPYFREVRRLGVTRISLGIQSFDDATLRALGRGHTALQAREAYVAARQAGFDNVNMDLMFGAPRIEVDAFRKDVVQAIELAPAHVSLYGLDIEERTPFGRTPAIRDWAAAHRDQQAEQYLFAAEALERAGYRHYEVSNFCLPGREGRQNLMVWGGGAEYLGLGPGAHSWLGGVRRANERHLPAYERRILELGSAIAFEERVTAPQAANERLMLALRQQAGLDVPAWSTQHALAWGDARAQICAELAERRLAVWDGVRLRLTRQGMLLADEITERLMVVE